MIKRSKFILICSTCGYSTKSAYILNKNTIQCHNCGLVIHKSPYKTYLKPWKDPESLFCDTMFLKEFIKKDIRTGKECKHGYKN